MELDLFTGLPLSEEEQRELSEIPHKQLLDEAFQDLTRELDTNGNSDRFFELRDLHSRRLIKYWQFQLFLYQQMQAGNIDHLSQPLVAALEALTVSNIRAYESDEQRVLLIERRTADEKDEVSISANLNGVVDQFMRPPTITSEVSTDPDEPWDITYKVIFGSNRYKAGDPFVISRFERKRVHVSLDQKHTDIYDTREIRCSVDSI